MSPKKNPQNRLILTAVLVSAALAASFAMSLAANQKERYWITLNPISAGSQVRGADIGYTSASLGPAQSGYLSDSSNPVGSIALRRIPAGELLHASAISQSSLALTHSELSLSVRAVDIPTDVTVGELVTIYHLHDAKNGETQEPLRRVLGGVFISSIDRKSANFGSDIALSISIDRDFIEDVLVATTSGRIVIVRSRG
jgi:hypothetical protein